MTGPSSRIHSGPGGHAGRGKAITETPCLSVGINSADLLHLGRDLDALVTAGVKRFHVDVMDGVFCPQMAGGPELVRAVASAGLDVDLHLMIDAPQAKLAPYLLAGARRITFHVEATNHPHRVLEEIVAAGGAGGVALNPGTPLGVVEPLLDQLDQLLLLTIDPGWPGQELSAQTPKRIRAAQQLIGDADTLLAVDGAITSANLATIAALGPDVIVSGSAIFASDDPEGAARAMLAELNRASVNR